MNRVIDCIRVLALTAVAFIWGSASASAQTTAAPIMQLNTASAFHPLANGLEVQAGAALVRVTALRADIIRVRIARDGHLPEDASWAVLAQARQASVHVEPFADADGAGFTTTALRVRVARAPLRLIVEDRNGRLVSEDVIGGTAEFHGGAFTVRKTLADGEHYFGLGDKTGPLDRHGQSFVDWNTDAFGFQESTDPIYKSIPFFIAARADGPNYGLLLDNTWRTWFDFGHVDPHAIAFGADDGPLDYYLIYGATPRDVVEGYASLTGLSPLPPLWSLGFQQSRYSYMSDREVRDIGARLRSEHIPADVLYLDIDYQDRNRPFTVNSTTFPDLRRLAADLRQQHFHLVTITDLHIARAPNQNYAPYDSGMAGDHFVKNPDGSLYVAPVWPGASVFPEFTRASTRAWWGGLYRGFLSAGISGFWNDMNEPAIFETPSKTMPLDTVHRIDEPGFARRLATHAEIHNVYGMENSRATYEGLLALAPDERPVVLTRASFAGGQRYAMTWTGDNSSTWNHLHMSVPMLLNLGLSGFAYSGDDIGGFAGSPTADLLTRWIEVGAFTPFFRDHAAKGTAPHEPWVDGPEHTAIRRAFIEERYRLMPYLYALADENARTGVPLMRPVFLEFPRSLAGPVDQGGVFMLGPDLLIAPPSGESPTPFDIVLPSPGWYDYWTGQPAGTTIHSGNPNAADFAVVHETPRLDRLPVFVRPGAIFARQPLVQSTAETPNGPLEIHVYPGPNCEGALYWDDGHSLRYRHGAFLRQRIRCRSDGEALEIAFDAREGRFRPWWRNIDIALHGWDRSAVHATLSGHAVTAHLDSQTHVLHILLPDQARAGQLRIQ